MNFDSLGSSHQGLKRTQLYDYAYPVSEHPSTSTEPTKKRASRAGTRSVSTLSATQLERKRANDRESQRALRQKTRDHIDGLERTISELRDSQDKRDKIVLALKQRNRELEEENSYLRLGLSEVGRPVHTLPHGVSDVT
jgi:TolA-binding protein